MKIYTAYIKPDGNKTLQSATLVPESFSWLAIIFPLNIVWAIMQRNWIFLMILLVYFVTAVAQFHVPRIDGLISAIKLGFLPFLGIWANDFMRLSLKQRGYQLAGVVSGRNESEAQLRFFEQNTSGSQINFHA